MSARATPDHSESESEVDEEEPPKILQEISHTQPDIVCKVRIFPRENMLHIRQIAEKITFDGFNVT